MFIARNEKGQIYVVMGGPVEGLAMEEVADDNEDLLAYMADPTYGVYSISKITPWTRMTDAEADTVAVAMNQQPPRFKAIYDAANSIASDSPFYQTLKDFLSAALSPSRAEELLARE